MLEKIGFYRIAVSHIRRIGPLLLKYNLSVNFFAQMKSRRGVARRQNDLILFFWPSDRFPPVF